MKFALGFVTCLALCGLSARGDAEPKQYDICLGDQAFEIEDHPYVRVSTETQSGVSLSELDKSGSEVGLSKQPPSRVSSIRITRTFEARQTQVGPPSYLIAQQSPAFIDNLGLSRAKGSDVVEWRKKYGNFRQRHGAIVEFSPAELEFFGKPVRFRCTRGLPAFSEDEDNSARCTLYGNLPRIGFIWAMFSVGSDLKNPWPTPNWNAQDFSAWQLPLSEFQNNIQNSLKFGNFRCN